MGVSVVVATGGTRRCQHRDAVTGVTVEQFDVSGAESLLHPVRGDVAGYVTFLCESEFDVIVMHAWQNWATDLALQNADRIKAKKILYSHCISTNVFFPSQPLRSAIRYLLWRPYWWKLRDKLTKLDGIIFLSDKGDDSRFSDLEIAREGGLKIHIIPNCLSPAALTFLGQPTVAASEREQLISVGAYQWQKGFDFVLHAYANSAAKNNRPLKLFGQKHSRFSETLYALASRLGLAPEYVSFHEGTEGAGLLEEYAKSYLFISGSHTECQPLVLLDANATGTPFVARASGCISSMPGGVVAQSAKQATDQINTFLGSQNLWQESSESGRDAARLRYHPDRTTPQLMEALLGLETD